MARKLWVKFQRKSGFIPVIYHESIDRSRIEGFALPYAEIKIHTSKIIEELCGEDMGNDSLYEVLAHYSMEGSFPIPTLTRQEEGARAFRERFFTDLYARKPSGGIFKVRDD